MVFILWLNLLIIPIKKVGSIFCLSFQLNRDITKYTNENNNHSSWQISHSFYKKSIHGLFFIIVLRYGRQKGIAWTNKRNNRWIKTASVFLKIFISAYLMSMVENRIGWCDEYTHLNIFVTKIRSSVSQLVYLVQNTAFIYFRSFSRSHSKCAIPLPPTQQILFTWNGVKMCSRIKMISSPYCVYHTKLAVSHLQI